MGSMMRGSIRWLLLVVAPISPIWWGYLISATDSDREVAVLTACWVATVVFALLELTGIWVGPEIVRAFSGGRPRFWLAFYLASNGIGLLLVSAASDAAWWEALWLEVGAALLLGSIVDLIFEIRLSDQA
jgi:hypothetical protein